ncbi:MAG: hypothetical protein IRZ03_08370 [Acidobacterium ailaaui]|nr:hypothetical protein [Pseudacidobacterium ailaaui]
MRYVVTIHFANGTHLTEETDEVRTEEALLRLLNRNGDYTVVPFSQVLYYDVTEDEDESDLGDDAAVFLAPSR